MAKVDLPMDTATSDIRAVAFSPGREGDRPALPDLLGQVPEDEDIGTVTAHGAYDTRRCRGTVIARGGKAIKPIRRNGRARKENCPAAKARNETLRATRQYGRAFGTRWTGYYAPEPRAGQDASLKAFGERITARGPDRQTGEIHIRLALINHFDALGTAEIVRVA
ncbi:Transposase DDE domain-containing protein [Alloyangia pacifica]|uniref:Transposase DDE domain-containing protein n=1 Tax=Alloyangia pacifica TaxID=311180 RepID=A0A1I6WNB0_9RHOB|nr:Transposase DDE domain-containing protein [Alloyangia pacifica]SFT27525.1 Transposase DDE domain-containing protein [Alloyangia pacifica]